MQIIGDSRDIMSDDRGPTEKLTTGIKQETRTTAPRLEPQLAESKPGMRRPEPGQGDIKEAITAMSSQSFQSPSSNADLHTVRPQPSVNSDKDGSSGLAVSVIAKSYKPPLAMPEKRPGGAEHQNIEISIGSISMEIYQKQPAVTMITPQPKSTGGTSTSSTGQSSGFRPSRYYLRGI